MPTFQYEALNESGQPQRGTITAQTSDEAIARIRSQGYFPTSVREQKVKKASKGSDGQPSAAQGGGGAAKKKSAGDITINIGGVSQKDLTSFTRQLSTLQDAGLPILRSIAILEQQQKPGLLKDSLSGVHEDVSAGSSLSDAMAQHPKAFNRLYTKMIAAGEVGGVLDLILQRLAEFLEKAARLKRRIISAMIYPIVVISIATLIVLGIMMFIVPRFREVFESLNVELPAVTNWLIAISTWLAGPIVSDQYTIPGGVYVLLAPFVLYFALKLIRKSKGGKSATDKLILMMPVVGDLVSKISIARFTRTLGTLVNAGVPILYAIRITSETTGNYVYSRALMAVHDSVRQGETFAEPLRKAKVCDPIVINMIDVGEETGDLDKMLAKIADNYEEEVDNAVNGLVSLLEPLMVVFLGLIVGFIVLALFLPMVKLMTSLSSKSSG
jgi:type IV pilus assembly protein PilC